MEFWPVVGLILILAVAPGATASILLWRYIRRQHAELRAGQAALAAALRTHDEAAGQERRAIVAEQTYQHEQIAAWDTAQRSLIANINDLRAAVQQSTVRGERTEERVAEHLRHIDAALDSRRLAMEIATLLQTGPGPQGGAGVQLNIGEVGAGQDAYVGSTVRRAGRRRGPSTTE